MLEGLTRETRPLADGVKVWGDENKRGKEGFPGGLMQVKLVNFFFFVDFVLS